MLCQERLHARQILPGLYEARLRLGHSASATGHCCAEWHLIDSIEPISLLDLSPLLEVALLDDARHLRSNFYDSRRFGLTDELGLVGNRSGCDRDHPDFRHLGGRRGLDFSFTARQRQGGPERQRPHRQRLNGVLSVHLVASQERRTLELIEQHPQELYEGP